MFTHIGLINGLRMDERVTNSRYWEIFDHISKVMKERGDTRDPHEVVKSYIDKYYGKNRS